MENGKARVASWEVVVTAFVAGADRAGQVGALAPAVAHPRRARAGGHPDVARGRALTIRAAKLF